jgi:hypothetical protein
MTMESRHMNTNNTPEARSTTSRRRSRHTWSTSNDAPLTVGNTVLHHPQLLYMLEQPEFRVRKVGITVSERLAVWACRGWTILETIEYTSDDQLHAAEAAALYRLDQFRARGSENMQALFPTLHSDGRNEMFDPLCFRGTLDDLLGDDIGEQLRSVERVEPTWIVRLRHEAARA